MAVHGLQLWEFLFVLFFFFFGGGGGGRVSATKKGDP